MKTLYERKPSIFSLYLWYITCIVYKSVSIFPKTFSWNYRCIPIIIRYIIYKRINKDQ